MSESKSSFAPRPRTANGARPYDLGEPNAERVLAITMALAAEVAALHERLDAALRLGAERGGPSLADIEAYEPSAEVAAERDAWRKAYVRRILRILQEDLPDAAAAESYAAFVKEIS